MASGKGKEGRYTIILRPTKKPLPLILQLREKHRTSLPVHIRMPRRKPIPAFFGRLHVPFAVGDEGARLVVDDLPVSHRGLGQDVVTVGVVPPLPDAGGVGHQVDDAGVSEGVEPEVGNGGEVFQGDGLDLEHSGGLVCRVLFWFLELT